jgi:hypothetical protein
MPKDEQPPGQGAERPVAVLAKALKVKPQTVLARLHYYGVKSKGATLAELAQVFQQHSKRPLPPAVRKLIDQAHPPPAQNNPRKARGPPKRMPEQQIGLIALKSVETLTCEKVGTGDYDDRDLRILTACLRFLPRKR